MELVDFLLEQHARSHAAAMVGAGERMAEDQLLDGLNEDQLRLRPARGLNSIVWLLWHMARSEDVAVNLLLAGRPQVLDEDVWLERLGIDRRDMGTGMSDEEVATVGARLDIAALRAYRAAVGRRTREVMRGLRDHELDEPIDAERLLAAGAFPNAADGARRVATYWHGRPKRYIVTSSITTHSYLHLGEATCIKTLVKNM